MMQLVEPPTAMASATALSKDAALRISDGLRSSQTISTIRRPVWLAMRAWPESAAGIELAPGRVRPSVSAIAPMVEAVPIVMQWPGPDRKSVDSGKSVSVRVDLCGRRSLKNTNYIKRTTYHKKKK